MSDITVLPSDLPRWQDGYPCAEFATNPDARLPVSYELNQKVIVWQGEIWRLEVDAIVNTTNESITDLTGIAGAIFEKAGGELEEECYVLEGCRTGEAKATRGYNLPCKRIIHTVGPRYNVKYKTAAESALHHCYRNCLEVLREHSLCSIAFPCVYTERKGYPRDAAVHIALRTVRRFLQKFGQKVHTVILVMENDSDYDLYQRTMPLYFPRTQEEEALSIQQLPEDIGDEMGETVCPEREIRVMAFPDMPADAVPEGAVAPSSWVDDPTGDNFTAMKEDVDDEEREKTLAHGAVEELVAERAYNRYLRRARTEDLSSVSALNMIYLSGADPFGRPVIVFVAAHFPVERVDLDKVMLYLIQMMDAIVERDYTVVYVHTNSSSANQPAYAWLKKVYDVFNRKYKKNLKKLYIVHPTWVVKTVFWFVKTFVSPKFWSKVSYIESLSELFSQVPRNQVALPEFVMKYDVSINGPLRGASSAGAASNPHDAY